MRSVFRDSGSFLSAFLHGPLGKTVGCGVARSTCQMLDAIAVDECSKLLASEGCPIVRDDDLW